MSHNVFANNNEVSSKASSGKTICNTPDVCFTPPLTPATPPGVPIPYPNTGMASDTTDGSTTVNISNQEVMLKNKSNFSKSSGDEAGSAPKKGVVTSKNVGKVYFNAWSMDVKVEGENVPRNLDITTNNHMSKMPGNTPPMPHISSMAMSMDAPKCEACAAAARAGNPVNPIRGNKLLDGPEDLDFILEGSLDLVWQRVYMSNLARIGFFGQGWMTSVEVHLMVDARCVVYVEREGRPIPFPAIALGEAYFHRQEMCTLVRVGTEHYRLEQADGLVLDFAAPMAKGEDRWSIRLSRMSDTNGNAIALAWDAEGLLERVDGSGTNALSFEWASKRLLRVWRFMIGDLTAGPPAPAVLVAEYEYSGGDLVAVTTRGGRRTREFEWRNHIMVRHAQPGGLVSHYEWTQHTPQGKVLRSWTNLGNELRFDYGEQRTTVIDQDGKTETFVADRDGHWIGFVDKTGGQHRRVLDADGHLLGTVAPSGAVAKRELDERGLPVRSWDAAGQMSTTDWHPTLNLPVAETDPLGRTERYAYDERGNRVASTLADGSETLYEYDDRGRLVAIVDALGKRMRIVYDTAGRVTEVTDCTGSAVRYSYDEQGQPVTAIDALGRETRFAYAVTGDLIAVTDPEGATTGFEYDALGRLIGRTEPGSGRTRFQLRPDGLPIGVIDAEGQITRYMRDGMGRLLRIENPNGAVCTFEYDGLDRITTMKTFEGVVHTFGYSKDDDLVWSEEHGRGGELIRCSYSYDLNGRPTRTVASDGEWKEFSYDAAGQLVMARNRSAWVALEYDAAGRCVRELLRRTELAASAPRAVRGFESEYDANGNLLLTRIPAVIELGFLHYGSGHLHQIIVGGAPFCDIERDASHVPRMLTHKALVSRLRYDAAQQLTGIDTGLARGGDEAADPAPTPILSSSFAYDPDGDLVAIDRIAPWGREGMRFRYDADRRVVAQGGTQLPPRPLYWDEASNPIDGPGQRAQDNMVRSLGAMSAGYDGFGRLRERQSAEGQLGLEWNAFHELVGVRGQCHGESVFEQYAYDAFGRRITKVTNGSEIAFTWEGERLLMEENDEERRIFVYHDDSQEPIGFILSPARPPEPGDADGERRFVYLHDGPSGAPFALTDEEGAVLWHASYDAFGAATATDDSPAAGRLPVQPLRLQGQYFDAATGLCYNRFRYFDPLDGRFISPDPIGLLGGENVYAYAPNPFAWIDPLGLKLQNKIDGELRQAAAVKKIQKDAPAGAKLQEECPLRSCKSGKIMKDTKKTGPKNDRRYRTRRLDVVVINKGAVVRAVEVTSKTASKDDQLAKEDRIRARGGTCIKDRETKELIPVPMASELMRLP